MNAATPPGSRGRSDLCADNSSTTDKQYIFQALRDNTMAEQIGKLLK